MGSVPPHGQGNTPSPATQLGPGSAIPPSARPEAPYTQPRSSAQYNSPIVTVNRNLVGAPGGARPPVVVAGRSQTPATPPFIISNSLAVASGLHPGRRAAAPVQAAAPTARLPPHKDLVEGDAELAAQRAHTRQRMDAALQAHQAAALAPDVATPFSSAQDVVERLLPYHVWQAPERDLLTAMDGRLASEHPPEERSLSFHVPYKRKRGEHTEDTLHLPPFPSTEYTLSVYARRAALLQRFSAIQTRSDTSYLRAPELHASLEQLERLVYEDEVRDFQELSNELRRARAELEEVERQRNWRFGVPAAASLATPSLDRSREWSSPWAARRFAASPQGTPGRADYSPAPSPITRPYSVAGGGGAPRSPVVAGSAASLPALTHAVVSHLADLTARSTTPASSAPISAPPPPLMPAQDANAPAIPTQPLPLVMPISAVPRLTALGIHLVPATHLIPALSLASAGQSVALNPGLTAPRPVVGAQNEPVLLVGITDAPGPGAVGTNGVSRQRLHLSVVLAKLRPEQLSGLAALMQALQAEESGEAGPARS